VRFISPEFRVGTTTDEHPVFLLVGLLIFAGFVWLAIIPILKRYLKKTPKGNYLKLSVAGILIGLSLRAIFFGSTPIYEDDWNRYLWDGAVITQGVNPYTYSPEDVHNYVGDNPDLIKLSILSADNDGFVTRINNPHLTTIYPPISQGVFAIGALIKPFDIDVLRGLYWLSEVLALLLLVKALAMFGRSEIWIWLYALNPMVIFTAFNGLHMDILLVPFILASVIVVKSRPFWAAILLASAVAVKLWPLLLGPVLFRTHRKQFFQFVGYGAVLGVLSLVLCLPMLLQIGEASGLSAYSAQWQRSSFIFPFIETGFFALSENGALLARLFIAALIGGIALWFGFFSKDRFETLPSTFLVITLALYLLSPTGFPWYVIWFAFLIPFVPLYGAALLCVTVGLYYMRFWFGEAGTYHIYLNGLVPLQFGLPIIVLMLEALKARQNDRL
jgi:hypothetical protein